MAAHLCAQTCGLPFASFNASLKRSESSVFMRGSVASHCFWRRASITSVGDGSRSGWLFNVHCTLVLDKRVGAAAVQGTGRPIMEDTYSIALASKGSEPSFFGVFDGHGGIAVAEMLKNDFWSAYRKRLPGSDPVKATIAAYLEFDTVTLAQPKGLFGALRERGVGGSRCGSTAATAVLLPFSDGKQQLIAANVGDARVVLSRGSKALQLSFDHKPNVEAERKRIEAKNPTPRKPLVVNVEGTWRVGGLLALSRAFGDAYLKDWSDGKVDGARGGFGLNAEPTVAVETLSSDDDFLILGTDGLFEKLPNQEIVDFCRNARATSSAESIAKQLIQLAQKRGVTDDISAVVVFLRQEDTSQSS
ncbi:hypothetical protein GOP47_0008178 [Adiantum capillus-veneris]|uniref:protein-serine/threonine phosphatase n=1 Tax=Adiantum capillus-veneris TaxID=13818 RepID=A0A9D4UYU3_ADICA|nr:hypothetical protein GOP47_0008178 [Adiantum capillus-veneris]